MTVAVWAIAIILVIFGFFGLMLRIAKDTKDELLDKMFKNDDISTEIYKKYK